MNRLVLHIEYLLLRHDCVVVPGFGAFLNVYHPAYENSETGSFMPMTREIRFNSALKHDDGLVADSYARRERIPFAMARDLLRSDVTALSQALAGDLTVPFGRLGYLQLNEGNVSYQPADIPARVAARLGFMPVKPRAEIVMQQSAVQETTAPATADRERTASTKPRSDAYYYIPVPKVLLRLTGVCLIVATVAMALILPFIRDRHEDQASVIPVRNITTFTQRSIAQVTDSVKAKVSMVAETTENITVAPKEENHFHLIVATFHSQEEADNFIAANDSKGYQLTNVASRKLFRVAAMSAADKSTLLDELNSDSFHKAFPQAWIFDDRN